MNIDLAAIGLTQDELQDRVVNALVEGIMTSRTQDEDGYDVRITSRFQQTALYKILNRVDEQIDKLVAPVISPAVDKYVEELRIPFTNQYGQPQREPETLLEYTMRSVGEYLYTGVNWQGKTAEQRRKSGETNWASGSNETNRITFMIDQKLQAFMEQATKEALKSINEQITGGLAAAVKHELNKINAKLKG